MSKDDWYSLKDIEKQTGISVPTLSRYADEYNFYILQQKSGNKRLIHKSCVPVLQKIKKYYEMKLNKEQIHEKMKAYPIITDVKEEDDLTKEVAEIKRLFENEVKELQKQLEQQRVYFEERLNERMNEQDIKLMEAMRAVQEQKRMVLEVSSSQSEDNAKVVKEKEHASKKQWWEFWK